MRRSIIFTLCLAFCALMLSACAGVQAEARVAVAAQPEASPSPTPTRLLYQVPPNATPTPTPFQPLPPTQPAVEVSATPSPTVPAPTLTPILPQYDPTGQQPLPLPSDQVNILLLGSDQRPWDGRYFRTDVIILATLNTRKGTVNLTSFPRDLYVTIPGRGADRINTAYEYGGFELLADTMQHNFGFRPDHYVLINFSSFKKIIDDLGGLEVEVAQPLSDNYRGRYITIQQGTVEMDADMVLWYVRSRKTSNDFARSRRQQEVLRAIFKKMVSLDAIRKVPEFYNTYKENVTTDLTFGDIVQLLPLAARITDTSKIHHYYLGPGQVYDWISPGGGMVLLPNPPAVQEVLRQALNAE